MSLATRISSFILEPLLVFSLLHISIMMGSPSVTTVVRHGTCAAELERLVRITGVVVNFPKGIKSRINGPHKRIEEVKPPFQSVEWQEKSNVCVV
ncbi:hypothetical protein GE09DRAFT_1256610 [Coniochaeta sp. 2T2.1]|nr:hypothetical protein GE09DRAFT_1256610 [Coniochaeta sp. 2T2.1]